MNSTLENVIGVAIVVVAIIISYSFVESRRLNYKDAKMRSKLKLWQGPPPIEKSDKSGEDS